jgi:hypothetical protein
LAEHGIYVKHLGIGWMNEDIFGIFGIMTGNGILQNQMEVW